RITWWGPLAGSLAGVLLTVNILTVTDFGVGGEIAWEITGYAYRRRWQGTSMAGAFTADTLEILRDCRSVRKTTPKSVTVSEYSIEDDELLGIATNDPPPDLDAERVAQHLLPCLSQLSFAQFVAV